MKSTSNRSEYPTDTHIHSIGGDARRVEIPGTSFKLTCTPAQHFTGRGPLDQGKTLWSSWAVEGEGKKVYFAGDTGIDPSRMERMKRRDQCVRPSRRLASASVGFDLRMIPIGYVQFSSAFLSLMSF